MSAAKSASKKAPAAHDTARALLALFECVVANARDSGANIEDLGDWADEFKPPLERILRHGYSRTPDEPEE